MTNETVPEANLTTGARLIPHFFSGMARDGSKNMKILGARMLKKLTASGMQPSTMGIERSLAKLGLARKVPGEGRAKVWQFGPERAQRGGKRLGMAAAGKVGRAKKSAPGRTRPPTPAAMKQAHRAVKDTLRGKRPGYEGA